MVSALLSLLKDTPMRSRTAMTGEITLNGRVLAVGGIREKVIAARRSKLELILLPRANQRDWEELPSYLTEGLQARFVEHYDEIYPHIFEES
jgi:ATP-dependent Lon protease